MSHNSALIEIDDSILIVIDAQTAFTNKVLPDVAQSVIRNICWLIDVAAWCSIPLIVTAEDYDQQPLHPDVMQVLGPNQTVFNKSSFGLVGEPDIFDAITKLNRKTAVLVGLETDVCVMQSALGLLQQEFRVVAVTDATASPNTNHQQGLARMQAAGVTLTSTKALFYEWLRTVDAVNAFHHANPDMRAKFGGQL